MEEVKSWKERFNKFAPFVLTGFIVLLVGLAFIGRFFDIRLRVGGQKIDTVYYLGDILFGGHFGSSAQIFFILTYLVFPLLACAFMFLGKIHNNFYVVSILLLLLCAINSILIRDIATNSLAITRELPYETHDIFFCYMLPIVAFFVAGLLTLALASKEIAISVKDITEIGVLAGLALVLNFVKIAIGETGGSINFQMLPLFILALRKGPLKGFIGAGIVYGLITCLTDGYGIACYPFDYLIGMGSVCILGFFNPLIFGDNQTTYNFKGELFLFVGGALSSFFRFVGGCASSMIIWGYDIQAALAYNVLYVFISGAISIAVLMAIYGPFIKINKRFPSNEQKTI